MGYLSFDIHQASKHFLVEFGYFSLSASLNVSVYSPEPKIELDVVI